jgi:Spy/CpxP family protein refolding chaperone
MAMLTSRRGRTYSLGILLLPIELAIAPWPAIAQSGTSSSALLSAEETRRCICLEDQITRIRGDATRVRSLEDEFNQLTAQLDQLRASMDVSDQAQVDNFRQIHERREDVRHQLQAPGSGLNALVAQWNANCADRTMLELNVDAARANPQCP